MQTKRYKCVIGVRDSESVIFDFDVHQTGPDEPRLIEPAFYTDSSGAKGVPAGVHHEFEVIEPKVWEHEHHGVIHTHQVPGTKRQFVCYTGAVPTEAAVLQVMMHWCSGTVYSMLTGIDYDVLAKQQGNDFYDVLEAKFGIICEHIDDDIPGPELSM